MLPRTWLLLRQLDEQTSLFFTVPVHTEEDEPAVFGATIAGLENRLVAAGQSFYEAERNAIEMFKGLVDYTLETSRVPLSFELGETFRYVTVPVKLKEVDILFDAVMDAVKSGMLSEDDQEWRSVPTSLLVASTEPASLMP
jgi:hypothetical protein